MYVKNVRNDFTSRMTTSYAESDTLESLKLAVGSKPIPRQWALSHPRLLFTQSSLLPYDARRTPRHGRVSCKVLHSFCSLPSSVTSLKLCDFLLLFLSPNSIFTWDVWLAEKSLLSQTKSHIHSAESLFSCLINHLNFSSACAAHPVVGWFPPIKTIWQMLFVLIPRSQCEAASFFPPCQ